MFEVLMDGKSWIWEKMEEPYGPFECNEEKTLFSLALDEEDLRPEDMQLVYSNKGEGEPGFIELSVYKGAKGFFFEFIQPGSDIVNGKLFISADLTDAELYLDGDKLRQWLTFNTAANFCYLLSTACRQTVLSHASSVIYKDRAYLFLGKSGTGKSTHSRMWLKALENVILMNDDHPVIRIADDGSVIAYGSPWSGKTRCYKNLQAPVGGIIRISRAPYNKPRRLSIIESYASLMTSFSGMTWERELADGRDRTIQGIIAKVPCWVMECLPDENAAVVCSESVTKIWA